MGLVERGLHLFFCGGKSHMALTSVGSSSENEGNLWDRRYFIGVDDPEWKDRGEVEVAFSVAMPRTSEKEKLQKFCRLAPYFDSVAETFFYDPRKALSPSRIASLVTAKLFWCAMSAALLYCVHVLEGEPALLIMAGFPCGVFWTDLALVTVRRRLLRIALQFGVRWTGLDEERSGWRPRLQAIGARLSCSLIWVLESLVFSLVSPFVWFLAIVWVFPVKWILAVVAIRFQELAPWIGVLIGASAMAFGNPRSVAKLRLDPFPESEATKWAPGTPTPGRDVAVGLLSPSLMPLIVGLRDDERDEGVNLFFVLIAFLPLYALVEMLRGRLVPALVTLAFTAASATSVWAVGIARFTIVPQSRRRLLRAFRRNPTSDTAQSLADHFAGFARTHGRLEYWSRALQWAVKAWQMENGRLDALNTIVEAAENIARHESQQGKADAKTDWRSIRNRAGQVAREVDEEMKRLVLQTP